MEPRIAQDALRGQIASHIRSGSRGNAPTQLLGIEVEHFMLFDDGRPLCYKAKPGGIGARDVLEHLTAIFPERVCNKEGHLLEVRGKQGSVSLEPASQLELSIAPHESISEVERTYADFRSLVDPYLAEHGCRVDTSGYHPTRRAASLETTPEERYQFMSEYFAQLETNGELMMRATASVHVSLDYADETDAVRKVRMASALAPIIAAITDNTQVFEGRKNHRPIRRFLLWREVDPRRCGTIPGVFSPGFGFDAYADWVLAASPIYTEEFDETGRPQAAAAYHTPAFEAYAHAVMDSRDVEHLLSIVWPDVRLKRVVELRAADSMPADCTMGYAALVKGLFYSERSLRHLEQELQVKQGRWSLTDERVNDAIAQIKQWGHAAPVYGHELSWWIELLFSLAQCSLDEREAAYLEPLRSFAFDKPWWDVR